MIGILEVGNAIFTSVTPGHFIGKAVLNYAGALGHTRI